MVNIIKIIFPFNKAKKGQIFEWFTAKKYSSFYGIVSGKSHYQFVYGNLKITYFLFSKYEFISILYLYFIDMDLIQRIGT